MEICLVWRNAYNRTERLMQGKYGAGFREERGAKGFHLVDTSFHASSSLLFQRAKVLDSWAITMSFSWFSLILLAQHAFRAAGAPMHDSSSVHAPTGHRPLAQGWPAGGWPTLGSLKERETTPRGLRLLKLLVVFHFYGLNPFGVD
jgi:hypothetical protein